MTTDRKVAIGAILALVLYAGTDIAFRIKDKLAQARVDGENAVREQLKKQYDDSVAARDKANDAKNAALQAEVDKASKTIEGMAALVNRQVPAAPKKITVNTGQPYTVTLQTGDSIVPAESAKPLFDSFEAGQKCQNDLNTCLGDYKDYQGKYTVTQQQYDSERKIKRRSKWSVLGEAACGGAGAGLASLVTHNWKVISGVGAGTAGFCGFKF